MAGLKILWFNWRCIKHPLAGGAEVYTHEVTRRLVQMGFEVVLVTSKPKGLPANEWIDGYKIVRGGSRLTVYRKAQILYSKLKENGWIPDVVVDEVNTIPFMTPLYSNEPIVMLIHQLCRDCWSHAVHPLIQPLGWFAEKIMHKPYIKASQSGKLKAIITVSESTVRDLLELGYPDRTIRIVHNGVDWDYYKDCLNNNDEGRGNTVLYFGRITRYKRIEDLLMAWKIVQSRRQDVNLVIAGRPDPKYLNRLKRLASKLSLERITFKLNVPRKEKKRLLASAKVLVYTSTREGWGQTVLEAAACKTPAIAQDVPGLRDSVKNNKTGLIVPPRDPRSLAEAILDLLENEEYRLILAENAYKYAKNFTWDNTAESFAEVLKGITNA